VAPLSFVGWAGRKTFGTRSHAPELVQLTAPARVRRPVLLDRRIGHDLPNRQRRKGVSSSGCGTSHGTLSSWAVLARAWMQGWTVLGRIGASRRHWAASNLDPVAASPERQGGAGRDGQQSADVKVALEHGYTRRRRRSRVGSTGSSGWCRSDEDGAIGGPAIGMNFRQAKQGRLVGGRAVSLEHVRPRSPREGARHLGLLPPRGPPPLDEAKTLGPRTRTPLHFLSRQRARPVPRNCYCNSATGQPTTSGRGWPFPLLAG